MGSKWDAFTNRSRKILQLGNQVAITAGAKEICTEHLLLALVVEGSGIAGRALRAMGRELRPLSDLIRVTLPVSSEPWQYRKVPFSQLAENVFIHAREEAALLQQNYVGTAALLLGLLKVEDGGAAKLLGTLGITYTTTRDAVLEIVED